MKKLYLALLLSMVAKGAFAGYTGPHSVDITSVSSALDAKDETIVRLEGYIKVSLGDEKYLFQDQSGEIQIEIDSDVWRGLKVDEKEKVLITGEVDKDWGELTIDVDTISKSNQIVE